MGYCFGLSYDSVAPLSVEEWDALEATGIDYEVEFSASEIFVETRQERDQIAKLIRQFKKKE